MSGILLGIKIINNPINISEPLSLIVLLSIDKGSRTELAKGDGVG